MDTVQRAQRPFPDLPEGCGRTSAFPGLAPAQRRRAVCHGGGCTPPAPSPDGSAAPQGLGARCILGTASCELTLHWTD